MQIIISDLPRTRGDKPELDACAILRKGQEAAVFAAFNFGDTELKDYELILPGKGKITPLLNSDWNCFGGRTARPKALRSKTTTGSVKLTLPPTAPSCTALNR